MLADAPIGRLTGTADSGPGSCQTPSLAPLFVAVAVGGLVIPNGAALALADQGAVAGSASALIGVLQYSLGAVAAPLVGIGGNTAYPMAIAMAALAVGASAVSVTLAPWKVPSRPVTEAA